MKEPEYMEGQQALDNFKRFASTILQANQKKKKHARKPASKKTSPKSDKD